MWTRLAGCVVAACVAGTLTAQDLPAPSQNSLGLPEEAVALGGSLVICGGGRMPEEVYDRFVKLAGASGQSS
jgi:hypothetical protein